MGGSGPAVLTVITVRSSWMMAKGGPGSTGDSPPNHSISRRSCLLFHVISKPETVGERQGRRLKPDHGVQT